MPSDLKKANEISQLKGASSWLASLQLKTESFSLNKREFFDAIRLRYRWRLKVMSSAFVCGKPYDEDHTMACQKDGSIHHYHNEVRDLFVNLTAKISNDVQCEPYFQPLSGEELPSSTNTSEEVCLDLDIHSFRQTGERAFF